MSDQLQLFPPNRAESGMELYEFKHLETGKKYTVFMDKQKADKQLADLNKDGKAWERRLFFEAIFDE